MFSFDEKNLYPPCRVTRDSKYRSFQTLLEHYWSPHYSRPKTTEHGFPSLYISLSPSLGPQKIVHHWWQFPLSSILYRRSHRRKKCRTHRRSNLNNGGRIPSPPMCVRAPHPPWWPCLKDASVVRAGGRRRLQDTTCATGSGVFVTSSEFPLLEGCLFEGDIYTNNEVEFQSDTGIIIARRPENDPENVSLLPRGHLIRPFSEGVRGFPDKNGTKGWRLFFFIFHGLERGGSHCCEEHSGSMRLVGFPVRA